MTFRGHQVLKTLIRCHFSPRESTGQSYIYSGRCVEDPTHINVRVLDDADDQC